MDVAAGQVIFRQGDAGEGLFVVVSGRLRVSVTADGPEATERALYDLGRGAIVGEMALVIDRPQAIARTGRRLITPTLPMVALSAGRYLDRILTEHLTDVPIEDLPLRLGQPDPGRGGRPRTRAAVVRGARQPGAARHLPAGLRRRDLLIDGAATDNVPVDVMRGRVGSGSLVAVDVSPEVEPLIIAPFGPDTGGTPAATAASSAESITILVRFYG